MFTLTIAAEDVKVTPTADLFEKIAGTTEADLQAKLTDKFRMSLINPFNKTFISIGDDGRLTLKMPGSSRGKMILEKR